MRQPHLPLAPGLGPLPVPPVPPAPPIAAGCRPSPPPSLPASPAPASDITHTPPMHIWGAKQVTPTHESSTHLPVDGSQVSGAVHVTPEQSGTQPVGSRHFCPLEAA